jgi:DNA-binding transcriptional LysR family regulator
MTRAPVSLAPMLDVGRLRTLLAVREHKSVTAAARALSCPPTDVAEQLATLERQLGVTLVEGEPRAPRLTPAGARLAAHAERVLGDLQRAEADVAMLIGRVTGRLSLGAQPCSAAALLGDMLARLRETAPEVEVLVRQLGPDDELAPVLAGDLDVAMVGEYGLLPRRPEPTLERRELAVEPVLIAVPAVHPAPGPTVRLADLAGERWIAGQFGTPAHELLRRAAAIAGFEPTVSGYCEDRMALGLVAAGHGVALVAASSLSLVPRAGAGVAPPGVRLLTPVDPTLRRTLTALVRVSRAGDPAVIRLLDALAAAGRRFVDDTPGAARPAPADLAAGPSRLAEPPTPAAAPAGDRNGHPGILPPPVPPSRRPAAPAEAAPPTEPPNGFPLSADLGVRSLPPPDLPPPLAPPPAPAPAAPPPAPPAASPVLPPPAPPPGTDLPRRPVADYRPAPERPGYERPGYERPGYERPGYERSGRPAADLPRRRMADESSVFTARQREPSPPPAPLPPRRARFDPGSADQPGDVRRFGPLGTLPPAPPGEDVRLSIFEELQSEWFSRRSPGDRGTGLAPWDSPADDGWRAAARLAEPPTAGTTSTGLPKRVPQALLLPGAVGGEPQQGGGASRATARDSRGRLSSYRDGVRRGRHAERPPSEPPEA